MDTAQKQGCDVSLILGQEALVTGRRGAHVAVEITPHYLVSESQKSRFHASLSGLVSVSVKHVSISSSPSERCEMQRALI